MPSSRGIFPTLESNPRSPALRADSLPSEPPGKPKNTGVGSLSLLQGIFPAQGSNPGLPHFRHILYPLSHQGSPRILEWVRSVQSLSRVRLFSTPWTAAHQASLSITIFCSLLKFLSIESVMPSNYLILCHPLLLLPSIFPRIRVFSSESVLHIKWPNFGASASVLPVNIQD